MLESEIPAATPASNNQAFEIKEKLANLEAALVADTPGITTLLRDIHSQLKKDSELVTLLSEEECSILVNGLMKQTNTEIASAAIKKKSGKKALGKITLDDL